ncbi:hypothetical protein ACFW9N_44045 [Streptomyces sp. NPDC059496]|uniref:hypothetical protein n=1 Tax=Streptomyces sp. NPDC059496 TaxID=3346851 RepID=UPI0036902FAA
MQVYEQLGLLLLYGQCPVDSGLDRFYQQRGFTPLDMVAELRTRGIGFTSARAARHPHPRQPIELDRSPST